MLLLRQCTNKEYQDTWDITVDIVSTIELKLIAPIFAFGKRLIPSSRLSLVQC